MTTGYAADFGTKEQPCLAGELVESVRKDHAPTDHFRFAAVDHGHHFYKNVTEPPTPPVVAAENAA
jgi:hypothetical protein